MVGLIWGMLGGDWGWIGNTVGVMWGMGACWLDCWDGKRIGINFMGLFLSFVLFCLASGSFLPLCFSLGGLGLHLGPAWFFALDPSSLVWFFIFLVIFSFFSSPAFFPVFSVPSLLFFVFTFCVFFFPFFSLLFAISFFFFFFSFWAFFVFVVFILLFLCLSAFACFFFCVCLASCVLVAFFFPTLLPSSLLFSLSLFFLLFCSFFFFGECDGIIIGVADSFEVAQTGRSWHKIVPSSRRPGRAATT